jgi:hypothetical protein
MRGKRSNVPLAADERWGASILPGVPTQSAAPANPDATPAGQPPYVAPAQPYVAPAQPYVAPAQPYVAPSQQYVAAAQQFSPPPPFSAAPAQYGSVPDSRFGVVPDPRFAAPAPQFGPPQGYAPSPYVQPGGPQYFAPPPPPGGMPVAIKIVLWVVGGLFVMGILAAIAIPVFLSQKQRPANRSVSVPATLLGQTQLHTSEADARAANGIADLTADSHGNWGPVSGAYFGTGDLPTFFVAAAKVTVRPTPADETAFMKAIAAGTTYVAVAPVGAGPYGGKLECGSSPNVNGVPTTTCFSIDSAAITMIVVFESSPDQAALLARQIIGSVEH